MVKVVTVLAALLTEQVAVVAQAAPTGRLDVPTTCFLAALAARMVVAALAVVEIVAVLLLTDTANRVPYV